jgi:hypothetical protein
MLTVAAFGFIVVVGIQCPCPIFNDFIQELPVAFVAVVAAAG